MTVNIQGFAAGKFAQGESDSAILSLNEITKTKKYTEYLDACKEIPKVELHAHLGGAVSLEFIRERSTPQAFAELSGFVEQLRTGMDYSEAFKAFSLIGKVLTSNKSIEEAAYDFCRSQYDDKVAFTELRTGLKRLDGGFEEYLIAVLDGLKRGMKDYPTSVTLVLSLRRDTNSQDAMEIIDLALKYREQGISGIDVSGESIKGDAGGIFEALKKAKNEHLPVTLHIGESVHENADQQMKELTEIQPRRVGHAVHLCEEAKMWIQNNKVVVEACIRSALCVSMINHPGDHPALTLFKQGHPVVFCTDDSTLFGSLSEELALVACLCNLKLDDVIQMQNRAMLYAFSV